MRNVKRNYVSLKKMSEQHPAETDYVDASPQERIGFIWEVTAELWSLKEPGCVERRLQRDVTNLIRPEG